MDCWLRRRSLVVHILPILCKRDSHGEFASLVLASTMCFERAAMQLCDFARKRKPNPQPTTDSLERITTLHEHVEDATPHFRIDPLAVITNAYIHPSLFCPSLHCDVATRRG